MSPIDQLKNVYDNAYERLKDNPDFKVVNTLKPLLEELESMVPRSKVDQEISQEIKDDIANKLEAAVAAELHGDIAQVQASSNTITIENGTLSIDRLAVV